jgi:hypothetical protein
MSLQPIYPSVSPQRSRRAAIYPKPPVLNLLERLTELHHSFKSMQLLCFGCHVGAMSIMYNNGTLVLGHWQWE